ncbi:MAG: hypothetical protein H7145_16425 [Akkermansiaceae bacterium]|nr:hypothetical protein [Armatimonadota bacterium]
MTDAPPDLLTVPADHCLVCGVAGERPGGACSRCGTTDADVRVLLRAGVKAYADARADALAGRFADARKKLRLAASLGLAETVVWRELHDLLGAADPAVTTEHADSYESARSFALAGKFSVVPILTVLPDTPVTRELTRLCATGDALGKRGVWQTASRYAAVGTICAVLALWSPLRRVQERASVTVSTPQGAIPGDDPRPGNAVVAAPPRVPGSPTPDTRRLAATHYPYPERLARRYYSDARSAFREKRYATAASLTELASETGKNTYLLPHALLLRAQIADITGDVNAPRFWAKIATDSPASSYAPLGLLRAAERSGKISGKQRDTASYLQELMKRYPLSNEARVARGRFYTTVLPGTIKEEALR